MVGSVTRANFFEKSSVIFPRFHVRFLSKPQPCLFIILMS